MSEVTEELFRNMNEFENLLSEGDIHHKELLKYQEAIEEGFDHIDHLLELHDSLPDDEENIPQPAIESIRIYLDRTMDYLGLERISLEENDMVTTGVGVIDHDVTGKEKKAGLISRIIEMFKKLFTAIKNLFIKLINVFKERFNIIFMMADKFFNSFDKSIKKLDPKILSENKYIKIKNISLASYFDVKNGEISKYLPYEFMRQYDIYDKITNEIYSKLDKFVKNNFKGEAEFLLEPKDLKHLIDRMSSLHIVKGLKLELKQDKEDAFKYDYKVIHPNNKVTDDLTIEVLNKEEYGRLNNDMKEFSKGVLKTFLKVNALSKVYESMEKYGIDAAEKAYLEKNKYADPDIIKGQFIKIKQTFHLSAQLFHFMFYVETESYRADVKYMSVTLKKLLSIK